MKRYSPVPFVLLLVTLISIFSAMIAVSQGLPTIDDLTAIQELGRQAALSQMAAPDHGPISVAPADVTIIGDSAFGIAVVRPPEGSAHISPVLVLFAAQKTLETNQWNVALEGTSQFTDMLRAAPDAIAPAALLEQLRAHPVDSAQSGTGIVNLSLPFATGETWQFNGPHAGARISYPRPALDFSPSGGGAGNVRAAADGVVVRSADCVNFLRINHTATWGTTYYSFIEPSITNGQAITRGTIVGNMNTGPNCSGGSVGNHVHFALTRNYVEGYIHGHNIGGYMVEANSRAYEGCVTRVRDGVRFCNGQPILNEGTIGTGATDTTTTWLFSDNLVGFSASANVTHTGFSPYFGAAEWCIDAAEPRILSPVFSLATPATHPYAIVHLATRNDACGRIFFKRSSDGAFADSRRVDFSPIADGVARDYVIDMSANANWNGTISQLMIDPGCTLNATATNRTVTLSRVQINRKPAANTNLLTNPAFASCVTGWNVGQDGWLAGCNGTDLRVARVGTHIGFLTLFQDFRAAAPVGMPFEITVNLANFSSSLSHQVAIGVRDPDTLGNALMCTFTLPPNTPFTTHTIRGRVPAGWNETRFDFSPITVSTTLDIGITAVNAQYKPSASFGNFECLPPAFVQPTPTLTPTPSPPDLRITITSPQGPVVPINTVVSYTFRLENVGGAAAGNVTFTSDIPVGLDYGDGWGWLHNGGFSCTLSGRRATCTSALMYTTNFLEVTMIAYAGTNGLFTVAANATLSETDLNPANNTNVSYAVTIGTGATHTPTPSRTPSMTPTPSRTPSMTPTRTPSVTPSRTPTPTRTNTPGPATVNGSIDLQGRPAKPHSAWAIPIRVIITRTTDNAVVYNGTITTSQTGTFSIANIPPGNMRIHIKHAVMLASASTAALSSGTTTIGVMLLRAGDADDNNVVNISDFSLLASAFGKAQGTAGYDARADFNGDTTITVSDFSLLAGHFGTAGAAP